MTEMMEKLEQARQMSERHPFPIYVFGNGKEIRYYASYNVKTFKDLLEGQGYWLVGIFENGYSVEA